MNQKNERPYEAHVDETLAMVSEPDGADTPLAKVYEFPMPAGTEASTISADSITEHVPASENYRFTKRAKRLGTGVVSVVLGGLLAAGISHSTNSDQEHRTIPTRTEVADQGSTVWDIAKTADNVSDPRPVVEWMQANNKNLNDGLDVGETIKVPLDANDIE